MADGALNLLREAADRLDGVPDPSLDDLAFVAKLRAGAETWASFCRATARHLERFLATCEGDLSDEPSENAAKDLLVQAYSITVEPMRRTGKEGLHARVVELKDVEPTCWSCGARVPAVDVLCDRCDADDYYEAEQARREGQAPA